MMFGKLAAVAAMAITALSIATGTANADPGALAGPAVQGTDHGLGYRTAFTNAGRSITTTLDAGSFAFNADKSAVALADAAGNVIESLPLTYQVRGERYSISPVIEAAGATLTLTPELPAAATVLDVDSQAWFFSELQRAAPGALVGGIIGASIGSLFLIGSLPLGILGAVIGAIVVGGQPLIDSGFAYFSGQ